MSGGPYGRGKAPERACMKLTDWPVADQMLWKAALTPVDPFTGFGGSRAGHRAISNRNIERGYGRWLTFLHCKGLLAANCAAPADRITPERARAYVDQLESLDNKKNTVLARLEELTGGAKVMSPERDWRFLKCISARVRARTNASSCKNSRLVSADQLFGLGVTLMDRASQQPKPLKAAIQYRDGLMIALLALRPLRLRNFAGLTLGKDLVNFNGSWMIVLPPSATKTHAALEYNWPGSLESALETYLKVHRPFLLARRGRWLAPVNDRLWVSSDGSPLAHVAIYFRITQQTQAAFGRSVNPHLFRDAAATGLAINDPVHVRLAAPLLGHRTFGTTERNYIQAQTIEAHRKFADMLIKLRRENNQ